MRRWFLSYHSPDQALAERLKAAIEDKDAATRVFFAPTHLRAGGSWSAQLAKELAEANGFILLIGESGIGKWQVPEYYEAHDRWVSAPTEFPLVVVLLEGQTAPGLPFLRREDPSCPRAGPGIPGDRREIREYQRSRPGPDETLKRKHPMLYSG